MAYKYKLKEEPFNVGDTKTKRGVKTTVRDIDPETGSVSWKVEYVPAFDSTFKEFQELRQFLKRLAQKTDDNVIDGLSEDVNKLFNKFRTHLRKNYPDEYKKVAPVNESELEDIDLPQVIRNKFNNAITTTKDFAAALLDVWDEISNKENDAITATNYMKQAKDFLQKAAQLSEGINDHLDLVHVYDKDGKMYGTGSVEKVEGDKTFVRFDGSTVKRFPSDRVKPVKEALNVSRDKLNQLAMNIGFEEFAKTILMLRDENLLDDIVDAMKMYQDGNTSYYNPDVLKEKEVEEISTSGGAGAYLTPYAFKLPKKKKKKVEENQNPGATLGPGPKAGPTGVKDNYYVKAFKYKLVPDKIKGSGIEVKKLF